MKTYTAISGFMLMALALSSTPGCTTKYLRLSEPPPQNPGLILPVEVRVEAKDSHDKLSGMLTEWDNGILIIEADHRYSVRTDHIKRMEIGSSSSARTGVGCIAGVGASAIFWAILILIL